MSILIYDDNIENLKIMENTLSNEGYNVYTASSLISSLKIIEKQYKDIEMLITKYETEEFKFNDYIEIIRRFNGDVKIIALSSSTRVIDEINSIELRVDEYLKKPVPSNLLLKRIEKTFGKFDYIKEFYYLQDDNVSINTRLKVVYKNGIEIKLSIIEYSILEFLVRQTNLAVSREKIYSAVWNEKVIDTSLRMIDVHISNIRDKLSLSCIISVRGIGYKLISDSSYKSI